MSDGDRIIGDGVQTYTTADAVPLPPEPEAVTLITAGIASVHVEGVLARRNRDSVAWWEIQALCAEVLRLRAAALAGTPPKNQQVEFRGFTDAEEVFDQVRKATQWFTNDGPDAADVARIIDVVVEALVNDPVALRLVQPDEPPAIRMARMYVDTAFEASEGQDSDSAAEVIYESLLLAKAELEGYRKSLLSVVGPPAAGPQ